MRSIIIFALVFQFSFPVVANAGLCSYILNKLPTNRQLLTEVGINKSTIKDGEPNTYFEALLARTEIRSFKSQSKLFQHFFVNIVRTRDYLINKNRNNDDEALPALYLFDKGEGGDAIGVIDSFFTKDKESDDFIDSNSQIEEWLNEFENIQKNLRAKIEEGFTAYHQLKELEAAVEGKKIFWKLRAKPTHSWSDFIDPITLKAQSVSFDLTVFKNGKSPKETILFESHNQLLSYYRKQKEALVHIFAHNYGEEIFKNSEVFDLLIKQAINFRRIEFLVSKASASTTYSPKEHHEETLNRARRLITDPQLAPRGDAARTVVWKEFWAEFKYLFSSDKKIASNRAHSKHELSAGVAKKLFERGKMHLLSSGWVKAVFLVSVLGTASTTAYYHMFEKGTFGEILAEALFVKDEKIRNLLGATAGERKCASSLRPFTFNVCKAELSESFIGPELAKTRAADSTSKLNQDLGVKDKLAWYSKHMLKLRQQMRTGELYEITLSEGQNAYEDMAREELALLVSKRIAGEPNGELRKKIANSVHLLLAADDLETQHTLAKAFISDYGQNIESIIIYFDSEIDAIIKHMESHMTLPPSFLNTTGAELIKWPLCKLVGLPFCRVC